MQIQINAADRQTRRLDEEMIRAEVAGELERFAQQITRVEVHIKDVNGPKSGHDKQCTIEARLAGLDPMAVTADAADVAGAVSSAAGKLRRLIERDLGRRSTH
jgi:ribosome-associated translation inhibitor RaiA